MRRAARSSPLDAILGPDSLPEVDGPATRLQVVVARVLGAQRSLDRWTLAITGALVAVLVGLLTTALSLPLWKQLIALVTAPATYGPLDPSVLGQVQSYVRVALAYLATDPLKMLALEHGVPLGTSSTVASLPITGFLLLPALALTLGGCVAGAGDCQRRPLFSIVRGALIAPFYAIFLALCAFLSATPSSSGFGAGGLVSPSVPRALLLGLLWGIVFGGLGGWIQLAGSHTLSALLPTLQAAALAGSRVAASVRSAVAGAVLAVGSGLLFSLVLCLAGFAFFSAYTASLAAPGTAASVPPAAQLGQAVLLALSLAPAAATWLFAFASGAPIATAMPSSSTAVQFSSFGLIGAQHGVPAPYWYALALVPALCYALGGRAAARAGNARTAVGGLLAGALIAIPAALLMAAAAFLTTFSYGEVAHSSSAPSATLLAAGPDSWRTFVATLVGSAVFGALGGASALAAPALGALPRLVIGPVSLLGAGLYPIFDRLTGHPTGQARPAGRRWLYDALLLTILGALVAAAFDVLTLVGTTILPYQQWAVVTGIVAAATLGVPLVAYVVALLDAVTVPSAGAQAMGVRSAGADISEVPLALRPYGAVAAGDQERWSVPAP